ncbi:FtsX-like permease family protein [Demequina sp.]|uniref:FtsX-like permease family protein n=1 Tax=Demequina sp. TaxID=2050685 RepID=UPI003D0C0E76
MTDTMMIDVAPASGGPGGGNGTFAAMGLLVRRRMWRDRWLVVSSALIVGLATVLALAGPELVRRTIDDGAADAVTAAGPAADIYVTVPVGNPGGDNVSSIRGLPVAGFASLGEMVVENLPPNTKSVVSGYDTWLLSGQVPIGWSATPAAIEANEEDGKELVKDPRVGDYFQFGFANEAEVTLVDGRLPDAPPSPSDVTTPGATVPPTEVAISQEVADALEIGIGYQTQVSTSVGESLILEVVGIVEPADPEADVWEHFPEFTAPLVADEGAGPGLRRGTIMMSEETYDGVSSALRTPFPGTVRIQIDPDAMTLDLAKGVASEVSTLSADAKALTGPEMDGVNIVVKTGLDEALSEYPARARAALAQMSVIIAGVVSVAAVVIALMAALVLTRRQNDIALERARGASVLSIGLRLLVEALLMTGVGLAAGIILTSVFAPQASLSSGLLWVVALAAALSSPVLGSLQARGMWTGRREAANRQDRAKVAKAKRARRLTLEALTIVIAAAAVVSLRGRSVLQNVTQGIDPFLAAAPVLIALAVVVIVIRLYPAPMAVIQFFAKRTRGVAGVISLAKARESIPGLPLLGITLAVGIAVSGGLLVSTVHAGQEQASWDRVGADVRIESQVTDEEAAALEGQGLVVSRGLTKPEATIAVGSDYTEAFLLAMDENYPTILTMSGVTDVSSLQKMYDAAAGIGAGDPIPSLASQEIIDVDVHDTTSVYVGRVYVPIDIDGLAEITPEGWTEGGPYLIMPAEPLLAYTFDEPVVSNIAFVSGPGAAEAVTGMTGIDQSTVITREAWMASMQDSALIGGVERAIFIAVVAVGLLAAVALLVTVLRGVRERGRALSMLRTQGMGTGYGWWLAFAELVPLTLAAVFGGAIAGVAIMWLLGDTLGLKLLSGGLSEPPLTANWPFLAIVGGGILVLLFFSVAVEVLAHRRNKLSEVLRWGESR